MLLNGLQRRKLLTWTSEALQNEESIQGSAVILISKKPSVFKGLPSCLTILSLVCCWIAKQVVRVDSQRGVHHRIIDGSHQPLMTPPHPISWSLIHTPFPEKWVISDPTTSSHTPQPPTADTSLPNMDKGDWQGIHVIYRLVHLNQNMFLHALPLGTHLIKPGSTIITSINVT